MECQAKNILSIQGDKFALTLKGRTTCSQAPFVKVILDALDHSARQGHIDVPFEFDILRQTNALVNENINAVAQQTGRAPGDPLMLTSERWKWVRPTFEAYLQKVGVRFQYEICAEDYYIITFTKHIDDTLQLLSMIATADVLNLNTLANPHTDCFPEWGVCRCAPLPRDMPGRPDDHRTEDLLRAFKQQAVEKADRGQSGFLFYVFEAGTGINGRDFDRIKQMFEARLRHLGISFIYERCASDYYRATWSSKDVYLPTHFGGVPVFVIIQADHYQAYKTYSVPAGSFGIGFRCSKVSDDFHWSGLYLAWGDSINAANDGDGWLKCSLPYFADEDEIANI